MYYYILHIVTLCKFKIGLQIVSDSKLFNTFLSQCISLRDTIPSFTFLFLKIHSFTRTFGFFLSTLLEHIAHCVSLFSLLPFPFFHSPLLIFCSLDLCSSISHCSHVPFLLSSIASTHRRARRKGGGGLGKCPPPQFSQKY